MRGFEFPVIPLVYWKGVALPWQRLSRTFKILSISHDIFSLFSVHIDLQSIFEVQTEQLD